MEHVQRLDDPSVDRTLQAKPAEKTVNGKTITTPFASPADWRDHWIYFLMVDRFNNPHAIPEHDDPYLPYQGGKFDGVLQKLDYLKKLGVGAIWLSPVHYNPQWFKRYYGGYGIQDFLRIEPRFCKDTDAAYENPALADEEFRNLIDEIHARDMYVVADIVLNHMGDLFNYEGMKETREWKQGGIFEHYDVHWRDENGIPQGSWTDIGAVDPLHRDAGPSPLDLQRNDFFRRRGCGKEGVPITMGDFDCLKELVTDYLEVDSGVYPVRNLLIRAFQYFISKFDVDAFRIDTLQYVDREFARIFGNAMREHALSIGKKNFLCMGEIWQDDKEEKIAEFIGRNSQTDHGIIGVDTAIDFPMRKRLVETIKGWKDEYGYLHQIPPEHMARHYKYRQEALREISSSHGDASSRYVTFLDNHDLNERFGAWIRDEQVTMGLTCLFTMIGIPCVYYGTEQGLRGSGDNREHSREALWGHAQFDMNHPFYQHIKTLAELRKKYPPIVYGRQYFRPCSGDGTSFGHSPYAGGVIAYSRILNTSEILVVANTSLTEAQHLHVIVDRHLSTGGRQFHVIHSNQLPGEPPDPVANTGHRASVLVRLKPMEAQVLA
jgi:glycosidase